MHIDAQRTSSIHQEMSPHREIEPSTLEKRVDGLAHDSLPPTPNAVPPSTPQPYRLSVAKARSIREALPVFNPQNSTGAILQQAHQMKVRQTQQALATAPTPHQLPTLARSQNPVTRVKSVALVPTSIIEANSKPFKTASEAKQLIKDILITQFKKHATAPRPDSPNQSRAAKQIYSYFDEIKDILDTQHPKREVTLDNLEDKVLEPLNEMIEALEEMDSTDLCKVMKTVQGLLTDVFKGVETASLEKFVQRDDLLNKISILEALHSEQLVDPDLAIHAQDQLDLLSEIRSQLKSSSSSFLPQSSLLEIAAEKLSTEPDIVRFLSTAETYYSSADILATNAYSPSAQKMIDNLPSSQKVGQSVDISFKLGLENARELLANEINLLTKANPYLSIKTEAVLENTSLQETNSPRGLTSIWLTDGESVAKPELMVYFEIRKTIAVLEFRGAPVPDDVRERFNQLETHLRSSISARSAIAHAVQDIEMQAYDSHPSQYANVSGDAYCFDFARHLAPSTCFTRKGSRTETTTQVALRSTFLDFPTSKDPLPADIVKNLLTRDMAQVEEQLRHQGRIGDPAFFAEAKTTIQELLKDASKSRAALQEANAEWMREVCEKYEAPFYPDDLQRSHENLMTILEEVHLSLQETCFRQVHPQALESWKSRVASMQEYVRSEPTPTVEGLRNAAYPQLTVFFKVLERLDINPGGAIGINFSSGVPKQTTLESVIRRATEENLASSDELALMQTNLALLQSTACSGQDLTLTMDL